MNASASAAHGGGSTAHTIMRSCGHAVMRSCDHGGDDEWACWRAPTDPHPWCSGKLRGKPHGAAWHAWCIAHFVIEWYASSPTRSRPTPVRPDSKAPTVKPRQSAPTPAASHASNASRPRAIRRHIAHITQNQVGRPNGAESCGGPEGGGACASWRSTLTHLL